VINEKSTAKPTRRTLSFIGKLILIEGYAIYISLFCYGWVKWVVNYTLYN